MSVTVNISDVTRATAKAVQEMQNWPRTVEDTLRNAAQEERSTKTYQNQTGHLQQGTRAATISQTANEIIVDLEMGEPYASYVVRRGFSRFPRIADKAERSLNRAASRIATKLSRL